MSTAAAILGALSVLSICAVATRAAAEPDHGTSSPPALAQGKRLCHGDTLTSIDHAFSLSVNRRGALIERDSGGQRQWTSRRTSPQACAAIRRRGALQMVSPDGAPLWRTGVHATSAGRYRLVLRDTGALVVRRTAAVPLWSNKMGSRCRHGIGRHAIVVSIGLQHLWACQGRHLVLTTAITTGAYRRGWVTPTGSWRIYAKERDTTLNGPSWNDHVKYWMPYDGPFGLHDANWQKFPEGSRKYATNGSHGCTHVPLAAMQQLYHWAPIGTRVSIRA